MNSLWHRLYGFLTIQPKPGSAFQLTPRHISGVSLSTRDRIIKSFFLLPLGEGLLRPSFSATNIMDPDRLSEKLGEGLRRMDVSGREIALLMPEVCQKTFIFSFDSFPDSRAEQEQLIRFRIKRQMPKLSDDVRVVFDVTPGNNKKRVLAAIAMKEVIQEYERLFLKHHLKPGVVGIPVLSLSNLIDWQSERDFVLVNVEEDEFGLIAVVNGDILVCRQKSSIEKSSKRRIDNIIQEIENTVNFIEDRESRKIETLWIRLGELEFEPSVLQALESSFSLDVKKVDDIIDKGLNPKEKKTLSPLLGQIL
jgi:Tfp pilus assembly PilM family ATPase